MSLPKTLFGSMMFLFPWNIPISSKGFSSAPRDSHQLQGILTEATRRAEAVVDVLSCNRLHGHSSQPGAGSEVWAFLLEESGNVTARIMTTVMTRKNVKNGERCHSDVIHVLVILHLFIIFRGWTTPLRNR